MRLPFTILVDPISFFFGFVIATILWWVIARGRPLWKEISEQFAEKREQSLIRRASNVEENHRRSTLRRAQGMHLAAPLFALDEILEPPRLLAPPARIEPSGPLAMDDAVTLTLPYLPAWPELAAVYNAPTLTPGQALSGGMNVVIVGQPGVGKTVALAHIASLAANRDDSLGALAIAVPFLLQVADLKLPINAARDVLDRLIEMTSEYAAVLDLGRVSSFVEGAFRSGRALLLLDGFDELTAEGQQEVSSYLKLLLQEYPKARVVTTGAPEYLDGLLSLGFVPLALAAWSKQREAHFIRQWSQVWMQSVVVESWAQTLAGQPDPLLLNIWLRTDNKFFTPFELTLKVWSAYAGDSMGPDVLDSIESHIRRLAPANTPLSALEALAMQVTLGAQPIFDPRKARAWVRGFELPEEIEPENAGTGTESGEDTSTAKGERTSQKRRASGLPSPTPGFLGQLVATGLLISYPNNQMRFMHPIFGGFLAGRALSAYRVDEVLLNQPDWIGKLLAMRYLASQGDVSSLIKTLLEWSRLPMHRPMLTAARWLRDAPSTAPWRLKLMAALAELLQTEGLPLSLRGQAVAALVASGDPGVAALFRQYTITLSFELMRLVTLGSGAVQDAKAVRTLKRILQAPSVSARRAACLALISIGTTEALETVAHALLTGDEELRRTAAEALANDPNEGHAMLKDGVTMPDILLRRAVAYGLGRVDEPWASELLEKLLLDDQWVVRNSASEVIESQNHSHDPRVPRRLKDPSESPWLIELAAAQGVGISPGAPATDILIDALKSSKDDGRLVALEYLKQNPSEGSISCIYAAMYDGDPELREAAYMTLWEIDATGYKLPHPAQFGFS